MWTALDIYLLGVWQNMGPHDPDVLGQLQPHARFWMMKSIRQHMFRERPYYHHRPDATLRSVA